MWVWAPSAKYAAVVFAAGFVLGVVRVLWLEPWLGDVGAVLAEGPVMLGVSYAVARRIGEPSRGRRLAIGFVALGMLMVAELAIAPLALRDADGGWLLGYFAKFGTKAGAIGAVWQLGFALMPAVAGLRGSEDGRT